MAQRRVISSGSTFEDQIGYARAVIDGDRVHLAGTTGFDYTDMTISDDVSSRPSSACAPSRRCWPRRTAPSTT